MTSDACLPHDHGVKHLLSALGWVGCKDGRYRHDESRLDEDELFIAGSVFVFVLSLLF